MADRCRFGYVATPEPGHEQFIGRLSIPYLTPAGTVNMRFRSIDGAEPKYLGLPATDTNLYLALDLEGDTDVVAICEGEIDAAVCSFLVGVPAVGVPGASNWKPHYARCVQDFGRVVVLCDGDKAGKTFGSKVAKEIDRATPIWLPDGEDVNSLCLSEGADGLRQRMGLD